MEMTSEEFRKYIAKKHDKSGNANELTNAIIRYLNLHEGFAWRNNTGVVFDVRNAAKTIAKEAKLWIDARKFPNFKEIEKILRKCFRKGSGHPGESDIYFLQKKTGLFYAIEVKFGKDKLSFDQKVFLNDVERNGGKRIVARSLSDVIEAIE